MNAIPKPFIFKDFAKLFEFNTRHLKCLLKILLILICISITSSCYSQSFFWRLFHKRASANCTDKLIFKNVSSVLHFKDADGTDHQVTVNFEKSPAFANQPPTYTTQQNGQDTNSPSDEDNLNCVTRNIILSAQSTSFMNASYEEQGQHIFPGAIYEFSSFTDGSFNEISNSRNSIELSTDNSQSNVGQSHVFVSQPSMATIREGINYLKRNFDPKLESTSVLRYQVYDYVNNADLSLKLSGGIGYATFSINNEFKTDDRTFHHYLTIDAIKSLYSINAIKPPQGYFICENQDLSNPVVISSVVYGMRVLANIDVKTTYQSELDNFKAKYSGLVVSSNIDFEYLKKITDSTVTINCYVVGGPLKGTTYYSIDELKKGLADLISQASTSTAEPISYTLSDLQGNIIGVESATDNIATRECTLMTKPPKLVAASIQFGTGDDNKDPDIDIGIGLYQNVSTSEKSVTNSSCSLQQALANNEFPAHDLLGIASVCNSVEFPGGSNSIPYYFELNNIQFNDFINGGEILIKHNTNKSHKWDINTVTLKLVFDNDQPPKQLVWTFNNSYSLGQSDCLRLMFNSGYTTY